MRLEFLDFESSEARKNSNGAPQSINTNIDITNAQLEKDVMTIKFSYTASYIPDNSFVRIGGKASFSGPETKAAFEEWKKTKKVGGTAGEQIVNLINYSASINAIFIARVFNLTPPIVPPTIKLVEGNAKPSKK